MLKTAGKRTLPQLPERRKKKVGATAFPLPYEGKEKEGGINAREKKVVRKKGLRGRKCKFTYCRAKKKKESRGLVQTAKKLNGITRPSPEIKKDRREEGTKTYGVKKEKQHGRGGNRKEKKRRGKSSLKVEAAGGGLSSNGRTAENHIDDCPLKEREKRDHGKHFKGGQGNPVADCGRAREPSA